MTRTVALRASALFVLLTAVLAAINAGAQTGASGAMVLVGAALAALTAGFATVTPVRAPVAIPVRRRRR